MTYGESYHAEHGPNARIENPRLMILLCGYGHVFPWDDSTLAASVDGYPKLAGRLRRLKCRRVVQHGDLGELTVVFEVADFHPVARIMRPGRRRRLSEPARRRLAEAGAKTRFSPGTQKRHEGQRGPFDPEGDPNPVQRQLALFDA